MNTPKILVINGPNLNFLGIREPNVYGHDNLESLQERLMQQSKTLGVELEHFQSNSEGAIVDKIQQAYGNTDFILINAGAYTHTSVAILDALNAVSIPFIEIHISNVHAREEFRHHSYLSAKAVGVIVGFGLDGYGYALDKAVRYLKEKAAKS
ncbi:MAG TPA: type II 3-dehydroquinate dehydratase [Candidatus Anaerobiospirillum pullistercoris]|uniref:3-dehydroquinate dehydratase n=1 Tax=Candidatus Anaerobiospirillum pullistercoris TaxID=2838452 RepID=A0A9D2B0I0_9GAMM|nr:type II 3-dehydroquinate dehydratase [Candidatus Anaerobiospirillum pullistercoris]